MYKISTPSQKINMDNMYFLQYKKFMVNNEEYLEQGQNFDLAPHLNHEIQYMHIRAKKKKKSNKAK